jgi:hypothetical protein
MARALRQKLKSIQLAKKSSTFYGIKDPLPSSQQFTNKTYPQSHESSTHPRNFVTFIEIICFKEPGR